MEYYSAIKRDELSIHSTICINLKMIIIIILTGRSPTKESIYCMIPFIKNSRKCKLIYSDIKHVSGCLWMSWGWEAMRDWPAWYQTLMAIIFQFLLLSYFSFSKLLNTYPDFCPILLASFSVLFAGSSTRIQAGNDVPLCSNISLKLQTWNSPATQHLLLDV